jgi:diguanylate cyclase (GGDEF)-like protein
MAGEDVGEEARRRLERLRDRGEEGLRAACHLMLAVALSDAQAGRPGALSRAEAAARRIDPHISPQVYDLALYIAAEMESGGGAEAGLRYGRRQLEQHWASRLASLDAMRARIQAERLSAEREILSRHARTDDLTGVGNRRALEQYLADVERLGVDTVALILLDVNSFKEVNDRHGHLAGDAVLMRIGNILARSIRSSDLAVRLGGDEFAVVLAHADLDGAFARAVDVLDQLDRQDFEDVGSGLRVTLSAGVAAGPPARITELRAEADGALYRAKAGEGRCVRQSRVARAPDA